MTVAVVKSHLQATLRYSSKVTCNRKICDDNSNHLEGFELYYNICIYSL